jgi:hypothetical protein
VLTSGVSITSENPRGTVFAANGCRGTPTVYSKISWADS